MANFCTIKLRHCFVAEVVEWEHPHPTPATFHSSVSISLPHFGGPALFTLRGCLAPCCPAEQAKPGSLPLCGSRDTQHSPQKAERETSGSGQGMEVVMCGHGARGAKHHARKLVPSSAGGQHSSSVPHTPWCGCTEPGAAPTPRYGTTPRASPRPGHSHGHGHAAAQPRGPAGCGGCSVPTLAAGPW